MDEGGRTILIVDDESPIRKVISQRLQREGYNCVLAASGEEALEKVCAQAFDLVLLDIRMPGMSGMEVLPQMTFENPDICVVMSTAVSDAQTTVEAMNLGAYDYVLKPFDLDDLTARVETALERRKVELENRARAAGRYSALVENLADAVFELRRGLITWCNERAEDILGYGKEELIGKDVSFLLPGTHGEIDSAIEDRGRLSGTTTVEKKDGSVVRLEYSASRIPGKEPMEIVAVFRDTTDLERIQEELEKLGMAYKEQTDILSRTFPEIEEARNKIKTLSGLLPVCGRCRKMRDDSEYWNQVEAYVSAISEAESGYSICPDCER